MTATVPDAPGGSRGGVPGSVSGLRSGNAAVTAVTIVPVRAGQLSGLDTSAFVYGRDQGVPLCAGCFMWLVRTPDETLVVDAGPGDPERAAAAGHPPLARPPAERTAAALRAHGVDPADIARVVLTHLHWDHVGGLRDFPNARFLVQAAELAAAVNPVAVQRGQYDIGVAGHPPLWVDALDRFDVVDGDAELGGGVSLLLLPGHTPGSQGVLVHTDGGSYLIAGDTVPLYRNWHGDEKLSHIPNGIHTDLAAYDRSFARIERLGAHVLPGHDDGVLRFPTYPANSTR